MVVEEVVVVSGTVVVVEEVVVVSGTVVVVEDGTAMWAGRIRTTSPSSTTPVSVNGPAHEAPTATVQRPSSSTSRTRTALSKTCIHAEPSPMRPRSASST